MPKLNAAIENHNEWNTPHDFLERVRQLDRRKRIGLDPCSNRTSIVYPRAAFTVRDNGLRHSWRGHGLVFVNMPYDDPAPWYAKAVAEFVALRARGDDQIVLLGPVKADTAWFHDYLVKLDDRVFVRGRMRFLTGGKVKGTGRFASVVAYAGEHRDAFVRIFSPLGWHP